MSCIYRTGQRFGAGYLTEVLLGKDHERIRRFGHDRVSTFGIGKELSADQWKSVYRQLVAAGLAAVDIEGHGGLRLTEHSRGVLRGEKAIHFRRDPERRQRRRGERATAVATPTDPEAQALWERLRRRRRELAAEQDIAPYMVFGDVTLREMVAYRPQHADALGRLTGIGAVKLERFGAAFLQVLTEHESEHGRPEHLPPLPQRAPRATPEPRPHPEDIGLTSTVSETLNLLRSGLTVAEIAAQRELRPTTVYSHLARCIAARELALQEAVALGGDEIRLIEEAFAQCLGESGEALKPVYDALAGTYDYGILRCVRAAMLR